MDFEPLIQALHSSRDGERRKAAEALRQRGEPGGQLSAEALIHMLLHDTIPLREAAADILRHWREYVPIEPLFLAMQDAHVQVRLAAKWALVDVGEYTPQERLLPYLADTDTVVRAAVLSALGTRAPVASVLEAVCALDEDLREVAVSLVDLLRDQIPVEPLISAMQTRDVHIRASVAGALGSLGTRIPIESLIKALHDPEAEVRLKVVEMLADEHMPKAVLRTLLDDPNQQVRDAALKALACTGDAQALALIVESLHADHEWKCENALVRLSTGVNGQIQMHEISRHLPIEELLHLLKDEWWPVGHMAARMIAELGEEAPRAEILALLSHPLPQARWAALYTLALLGEHIALSQCIPMESVLTALEAMESVLTALEAEDVQTRRGAAEVLDAFGPRVLVDRLLPLIEEEDTQVARVVAKRGRQEGIDALVGSLRTRDHAGHAATALGALGKRAPVEPLLVALSTSDVSVRQCVAEALYDTHPEILPQLVPELVETLCTGQVGPLLEPLRHVLLIQALAALRSPQPTLLAWFDQSLDAPDWEVRMWAAIGLSWMTPKTFEAPLEKLRYLLDDPESASVRKAARHALEALVPHQATDVHPE